MAVVTVLNSSRPPAASVEVEQWVLDTFRQLRMLRASLYQALTGQPMPEGGVLDDIPEKLVVVATELATNAIAHARPPTVVRLCRTDDSFLLDVSDNDPTIVPEFADARPPGAGGLGLQLARRIALDIGWYIEGRTKHVWAEFPIPKQ
jgi:serine/threonine-protein kinase RsbW